MIYSRQFLVISFLCRKTGIQTLVNFNWKMSRKTLKMDDLLEAVVDDKVIEILLDRLTDRMTERLSLMVKEENAAQTAELDTSLTASITSKLETSLTASITSKLESSLVNIANSVFNNLIAPYDERINALEEENKIMRSHLDHLDVYSRSENLVFHGLPESSMSEAASGSTEATSQIQAPTESHSQTEEVIINLCKESLDIELTPMDISTAHRLPRGKKDKTRPIIVRFSSRRVRDKIYYARRKLRDQSSSSPVFINENLTKRNGEIFSEARRLLRSKKIAGTWTTGGMVYVKRTMSVGEKPMKIGSLEELKKY